VALVDLSVVEQRYRAVLAVLAGALVSEVAVEAGVSRQSLTTWIRRYRESGLAGLADQPKRPRSSPWQTSGEVEALVCELRRAHPRWGALRLVHELGTSPGLRERLRELAEPVPSRTTVHRILVRHGLLAGRAKRQPREYRRWERDTAMALWQMDIVGGVFLASPRGEPVEAKVVTGVDDHSRYCVIASAVPRASGRAVCLALVRAMREYGIPEEILSDNGKQFTDRFGKGGEVLFDRICRDNGIQHRLTAPASPTTTGKVERFHLTLRRELLDGAGVFEDLAAAQAAVDGFRREYNHDRPHQSLGMATPASRFAHVLDGTYAASQVELPLRVPSILTQAQAPAAAPVTTGTEQTVETAQAAASLLSAQAAARAVRPDDHPEAVEVDRVVPPSGNLGLAGQQFWLGTARAGLPVTLWCDTDLIHVLVSGVRVKTVRSHLSAADLTALAARGARPAGPSPLPPREPGEAVEVERTVNATGSVSLAGRLVLAAEILGGRRVGIRIDAATLMFYDPDTGELLRTRPNPLTPGEVERLRGQRPPGPVPRPSREPVRVQRRASNTGIVMVVGQKIALGRIHAHQTVTIHVADETLTIELPDGGTRTLRRTTTTPVRNVKAFRPRKVGHVL
jgi:transposase InsO family protein